MKLLKALQVYTIKKTELVEDLQTRKRTMYSTRKFKSKSKSSQENFFKFK